MKSAPTKASLPKTAVSPKKPFKAPPIEDPVLKDRLRYIETLSPHSMAILHRFSPVGHPFFEEGRMETTIFETRFKKLGGMTPELSKAIGQRPTAYSDHVVADSLRLYQELAAGKGHGSSREER